MIRIVFLSLFFISSSALCQSNKNYFWRSDFDSNGHLKMVKIRPISTGSLNYKSIIKFLNGNNSPKDKNYLIFKKIRHDTLHLKIKNTTSLTQEMGTAGAMLYLAEITYNLTELKNIRYINMDFEEGDNATPGTYTRNSFRDK